MEFLCDDYVLNFVSLHFIFFTVGYDKTVNQWKQSKSDYGEEPKEY